METVSLLQAGDKILKCSASFGNDIWDAKQFGNVVYAIKTRNGAVYLQLLSNGGDLSVMKVSETQPSLFRDSCRVYSPVHLCSTSLLQLCQTVWWHAVQSDCT